MSVKNTKRVRQLVEKAKTGRIRRDGDPNLRVVPSSKSKPHKPTIYTYHDEELRCVMQVLRYKNPKTFKVRRPGPDREWIWDLKGVELVPYNLVGVAREERVFICEGEKDCERLKSIGLPASCNPFGAGKWCESFNHFFSDKDIIILPDNDQVGKKHGQQVAMSLSKVARSIKVVQLPDLPPGGDVTDWLEQGHSKTELLDLCERAERWEKTRQGIRVISKKHTALPEYAVVGERNVRLTSIVGKMISKGYPKEVVRFVALGWNWDLEEPMEQEEVEQVIKSVYRTDQRNHPDRHKKLVLPPGYTAYELMGMEFKEPNWAVKKILPEGLSILGGKPKVKKSFLALNLCVSVVHGAKALGHFETGKGEAAYLALEDNPMRLKLRLAGQFEIGEVGDELSNLKIFTEWPNMSEGGLEMLDQMIKEHPNMRLVIIDTLAGFRSTRAGKGDIYQGDYKEIAKIKQIADANNIAILLVHHRRKREAEDVMDTFSGTLGLTGAADGLLAMIQKRGRTELHVTGRDIEAAEYALEFMPQSMTWNVLGKASDIKSSKVKQAVYDVLKAEGVEMSPKEIAESTGNNPVQIRKALRKMIDEVESGIKSVERGKYIYKGT